MPFFTDAEKEELAELFPQRVSILAVTETTVNDMGETALVPTPVAGLTALRAQISLIDSKGNETSGSGEGATAISTHQVLLLDAPTVGPDGINERHQAQDDDTGQIYNILLADKDPTGSYTMLKCRRVSV
ncbi:MAG TPA: hypothetical protein VGB77_04880 [Abditibacteriaceae bacterium]|jgi:hypothetical protein